MKKKKKKKQQQQQLQQQQKKKKKKKKTCLKRSLFVFRGRITSSGDNRLTVPLGVSDLRAGHAVWKETR